MRAVWNHSVIAKGKTLIVEGNHYFPPDAVEDRFLEPSDHRTTCPWKGEAHYYHVVVGGERNANAAWSYPNPKPAAEEIRDHVAFWNGVRVEEG